MSSFQKESLKKMIKHFLAFEKQISDLEGKIEELRHLSSGSDINIAEEIGKLQITVSEKLKSTYSQLSPWQKVLVSRHPERPHFQDIIKNLFEDYIPLSGDRNFADDNALNLCVQASTCLTTAET